MTCAHAHAGRRRLRGFVAAAVLLVACGSRSVFGFEADVHFGLTRWLALQAGFTPVEADFIGTGDRRVDSGAMDSLELVEQFACIGKDDAAALGVQSHHYPSGAKAPAAAARRAVAAGGADALAQSKKIIEAAAARPGALLVLLGASLHPLQDSWAHQGVPSAPSFAPYLECDPSLASAHPQNRGGPASHKADITHYWPEDVARMAKATYEALVKYPTIDGATRSPKPWPEVQRALDPFTRAATKSEKEAWFEGQGFTDVSFLEGISLPDGKHPFESNWNGARLAALANVESAQRSVDIEARDFFSRLLADWVRSDKLDELASRVTAADARAIPGGMSRAEIAARLKLWRLRDHGAVADMAHSTRLTPSQIAQVSRIARNPRAFARYEHAEDAFYPLTAKGPDIQPLLAFIVADVAGGDARSAAAVTKIRNAPYDSLVFVARKTGDGWRLVSILSTVDH